MSIKQSSLNITKHSNILTVTARGPLMTDSHRVHLPEFHVQLLTCAVRCVQH